MRWKREPRRVYGESRGRSRTLIEENAPVGVPLGKRLEEAAVQAFAAEFRGALVRPGDGAYDAERAVFNAMIDRHAALIARCTGSADVIAAVNFAREEGLVVAVRGGGHSVPGYAVCEKTAKSGSGCSKSSALRRWTS